MTYYRVLKGYPAPAKRFALFSAGRAGSHLLVSLLNCHPDIYCHNDRFLLNDTYAASYTVLDGLSRGYPKQVFGTQLAFHRVKTAKAALAEQLYSDGWHLIHLKRRQLLHQCVSALIANKAGQYHSREKGGYWKESVTIDPVRLLAKMEKKAQLLNEEEQLLSDYPHHILIYEDDLQLAANHQTTADKVFAWLDLPAATVSTEFVRTGKDDLKAYIENYDELIDAVRNSRFAERVRL